MNSQTQRWMSTCKREITELDCNPITVQWTPGRPLSPFSSETPLFPLRVIRFKVYDIKPGLMWIDEVKINGVTYIADKDAYVCRSYAISDGIINQFDSSVSITYHLTDAGVTDKAQSIGYPARTFCFGVALEEVSRDV